MHDTRLIIRDNFLSDPEKVRAEALAVGFEDRTGPDGALYKHVQVRPLDEFNTALEKVLGVPVTQTLTMVRANFAGEFPHNPVHSDQICSNFACVLYLNLPAQCQGGTAFWKHKGTGWDSLPSEKKLRSLGKSPKREYAKVEKDWSSQDAWEQTEVVEMRFNRLIAYPSRRFHSRWPWTAFGTTPDDVRLIWVSFFDAN